MKNLFSIIVFFVGFSCIAQSRESEMKLFYQEAIKFYISKVQEFNQNKVKLPKIENTFFYTESVPKQYLPAKVGGYKINYLDIYSKKNKKLLKKGVYAIKISMIQVKGNIISVALGEYSITLKNHNYNFVRGSGSKTNFKYSCEKRKWILLKNEYSEI